MVLERIGVSQGTNVTKPSPTLSGTITISPHDNVKFSDKYIPVSADAPMHLQWAGVRHIRVKEHIIISTREIVIPDITMEYALIKGRCGCACYGTKFMR